MNDKIFHILKETDLVFHLGSLESIRSTIVFSVKVT